MYITQYAEPYIDKYTSYNSHTKIYTYIDKQLKIFFEDGISAIISNTSEV
jgi:hypothetical protein